MTNTDDWEDSDKMSEIDNGCGEAIERAISRFVPRDIARKVRKESIRYITNIVFGPSKSTPDEGPHETANAVVCSPTDEVSILQDQSNCRGAA